MVDSTCCPRKSGEFALRSVAGETILVPVTGQIGDVNSIYILNDVGAFIWAQIDGSTSASRMAEVFSREFEVPPEQAAGDVERFLAELENAGIIGAGRL